MNKKQLNYFWVTISLLFLVFPNLIYSQSAKEDYISLYKQTKSYIYLSPDYGENAYSLMRYLSTYGFAKVIDPLILDYSFELGVPILHTHNTYDGKINSIYYQDLYIQDLYGVIKNLHYRRKTDSNIAYRQMFAIYKIKTLHYTELEIKHWKGERYSIAPTEMYLAIPYHEIYTNTKQEYKFHIIEYSEGRDADKTAPYASMNIALPPGEYYLFSSISSGGISGGYQRGDINMQIQVLNISESKVPVPIKSIDFTYDESGNRSSRVLKIVQRSLMAYEEPEEVLQEKVAKRSIKIYSSIQNKITVEFSSLEGIKKGTIQVMSFPSGNTVLRHTVKNLREDIDLSSQTSGIYILLVDIDGEKTSYKLMK